MAEIGIVLVALVVLFFAARGCVGCAAEQVAMRLPPSVDAQIGKAGAEQFRQQYAASGKPSPAQLQRVQKIFDELRDALSEEDKAILTNPNLTVVVDETVNAFCLPGGEVFVLTGLLERVGPKGDDLVRGVLAHEIGHAIKRHGVRNLARSAAYGIIFAMAVGQSDQLTATLMAGASQLDRLAYSRSMETEADDYGVDLLKRAGHDPEGLAKFLESLDSMPVPQLLSTHPDSDERAKRIRERM